jgi:H+/Cl- antiporter ClcA
MTHVEYIAALLSIIVGLGVTDLAQSVRELVRPQRTVDWHWLPVLWAATTLLIAIQLWWNSFSFLSESVSVFFFPFVGQFLFLYLTCAFALPDPEWQKPQTRSEGDDGDRSPLDLEAFYFSEAHRRWYFGILIAFLVTSQIGGQTVRALQQGYGMNEQELASNTLLVVFLATLIWTDRRWVHAVVSVLSFLGVAVSTVQSVV